MISPFFHLLALALVEHDLRAVRAVIGRCLAPDGRTLDLGCGPGVFADLFARGDYVGVDPRPALVDYARRHRPGVFLCDELALLAMPGGRFDQGLAFDVFGPRSEATGRAIGAELGRLLVPGGRVLLIERAVDAERVARLGSGLGLLGRREPFASGFRPRFALLLSTPR